MDQSTQLNDYPPQIERPDCAKRHCCPNNDDPRITVDRSSSTDPPPPSKPLSTLHEKTDCPKYRSCLNCQDKPPLVNQFTQTSPPKPKKERTDSSKFPSTSPQLDICRIIVIECLDQPKRIISLNGNDQIPATEKETPDKGESFFLADSNLLTFDV